MRSSMTSTAHVERENRGAGAHRSVGVAIPWQSKDENPLGHAQCSRCIRSRRAREEPRIWHHQRPINGYRLSVICARFLKVDDLFLFLIRVMSTDLLNTVYWA